MGMPTGRDDAREILEDSDERLREPWVDLPVDDFIEHLNGEIQDVGTIWRQLDDLKRAKLEPSTIEDLTIEDNAFYGEMQTDRQTLRTKVFSTQATRSQVVDTITYAQHTASLTLYSDERRDEALQLLAKEQALAESDKLPLPEDEEPERGPLDCALTQTFLEIFNAYGEASEAETALINKVSVWLGYSLNHIIQLIEWLEGQADDIHEYRPLVEALARQHYDPGSSSIFSYYIDSLGVLPQYYQRTYINDLFARAESDEETGINENQDWLGFLLKQSSVVLSSTTALAEALATAPLEELPSAIRTELSAEHKKYVSDLKRRFEAAVETHNRPDHFTIMEYRPAERVSNKRNRGNRRKERTTPKQNSETAVKGLEQTEPTVIKVVLTAAQVGNNYITKKLQAEDQTPIDALMASGWVTSYIDNYRHDPKIEGDLRAMLSGLLREPRGNGSSKMGGQTITVDHEGASRHLAVWHLNPVKRKPLSIGETARQTRVYFATWPLSNGSEALILLDVDHKNSAEKMRGYFTRAT